MFVTCTFEECSPHKKNKKNWLQNVFQASINDPKYFIEVNNEVISSLFLFPIVRKIPVVLKKSGNRAEKSWTLTVDSVRPNSTCNQAFNHMVILFRTETQNGPHCLCYTLGVCTEKKNVLTLDWGRVCAY